MKIKSKTILIDFDGTCVTHEFPRIGKDIGVVPVLKELVANGHKLILFTMRSDAPTKPRSFLTANYLTDAVNWFKENDIPLYGIQTNSTQSIWTSSPKAYGDLMIDDSALGCPLLQDIKAVLTGDEIFPCNVEFLNSKSITEMIGRPYVDWIRVRTLLRLHRFLPI